MILHTHHKIPKHAGGTDDQSNLVQVTPEQHAELHFSLYLDYGRWQDYCSAYMLAGLALDTPEELSKRNKINRSCQKSSAEANRKRSETLKRKYKEGLINPVPPCSKGRVRDTHGRFIK